MSSDWLQPLRQALDASDEPLEVFLRDDDLGWQDERLVRLLDSLEASGAHLDMAAIPVAVGPRLASGLARRVQRSGGRLHLHQHGYRHLNYQRAGRKCEFGEARPAAAKAADLRRGRELLQELFGGLLEPLFTPPWNRCDQDTVDALLQQDYLALSRDRTATPLHTRGLAEIPVSIDWCKRRAGVRLTPPEIAAAVATQLHPRQPLGIMLHHEVMEDADLRALRELLRLLERSERVHWVGMLQLALRPPPVAARPPSAPSRADSDPCDPCSDRSSA